MSKVIDAKTLEGYRAEFNAADLNGDGFLSHDEFKAAMGECAPTDEAISALITMFDADGNGKIDFDEFVAMAAALEDSQEADEDYAAFLFFDKNHDGFISPEEFFEASKLIDPDTKITMDAITTFFKEFDVNGDGFIDFPEYKALMKKLNSN